jgi:hypothetical protein
VGVGVIVGVGVMVAVEVAVGVELAVAVAVGVLVVVGVWVLVEVAVGVQAAAVAVSEVAVRVDLISCEGPHPASTINTEMNNKNAPLRWGIGRITYFALFFINILFILSSSPSVNYLRDYRKPILLYAYSGWVWLTKLSDLDIP